MEEEEATEEEAMQGMEAGGLTPWMPPKRAIPGGTPKRSDPRAVTWIAQLEGGEVGTGRGMRVATKAAPATHPTLKLVPLGLRLGVPSNAANHLGGASHATS